MVVEIRFWNAFFFIFYPYIYVEKTLSLFCETGHYQRFKNQLVMFSIKQINVNHVFLFEEGNKNYCHIAVFLLNCISTILLGVKY